MWAASESQACSSLCQTTQKSDFGSYSELICIRLGFLMFGWILISKNQTRSSLVFWGTENFKSDCWRFLRSKKTSPNHWASFFMHKLHLPYRSMYSSEVFSALKTPQDRTWPFFDLCNSFSKYARKIYTPSTQTRVFFLFNAGIMWGVIWA